MKGALPMGGHGSIGRCGSMGLSEESSEESSEGGSSKEGSSEEGSSEEGWMEEGYNGLFVAVGTMEAGTVEMKLGGLVDVVAVSCEGVSNDSFDAMESKEGLMEGLVVEPKKGLVVDGSAMEDNEGVSVDVEVFGRKGGSKWLQDEVRWLKERLK